MRCETCNGTGTVPAMIETDNGPVPCPYLGEPCRECGGCGISHCCDGLTTCNDPKPDDKESTR